MMVLASASKASHPIFSNRCWLIFYTEEETRQGEREEQQQQKKRSRARPVEEVKAAARTKYSELQSSQKTDLRLLAT